MERRNLTHDEKKAAEAAFRGLPADPAWSVAAQSVYEGIVKVLPNVEAPLVGELATEEAPPTVGHSLQESSPRWSGSGAVERYEHRQTTPVDVHQLQEGARDQAIAAGVLIDVTPQAQEMGLPLPVGLSRSLWEYGIAASDRPPQDDYDFRVKDLLMALRLHLCRSPLVSPVTQFPALFSFPPDPIPQVCGVCAVVQVETPERPFLTLVLPTELSDRSKQSN